MPNRFILYVISWLATVSAGYSATLVSVYLPVLAKELLGSDAKPVVGKTGSLAGGAFLAGWALGAIALGMLSDKLGRKKALLIAILLNTFGMVAAGFAQTLEVLSIIRFVTGIGAGAILLVTAVIVAEAFSNDKRRTVLLGILINAFPVGFIIAGAVHNSIESFDVACLWGGSVVVLAILAQLVIKESVLWKKVDVTASAHQTVRASIWDRAYRKDLVVALVLFGSMLVGLWASYAWMPTWVTTISSEDAARHNRATINQLLGLGAIVGGIISGFVSDRIGRRKAAGLGYICVFGIATFLFTQFTQVNTLLFVCTFLMSTFIGFNQGVLTGYIPELFPTAVRGSATGLAFNVGRVVTACTVFSMGILIQSFGGKLDTAMLTFAVMYLVGLATLFFARETKGRELPV